MEVLAGTASRGSFRDRPPRCVLQHGSPAIQFASGSLSSLTNDPACTRGRRQASQVAPALQDAASHFPAQQRDVAAGGRGGRLGTAPLTSRAFRTAAVWPANSQASSQALCLWCERWGAHRVARSHRGCDRDGLEFVSEGLVSLLHPSVGHLLVQPPTKCWLCTSLGLKGTRHALAGQKANVGIGIKTGERRRDRPSTGHLCRGQGYRGEWGGPVGRG